MECWDMWKISFRQKNTEELKVEERRCLEQRGSSVLLDQNIRRTQILNTAQTLSGVEMVCWWQNEEGFGRICTEREYESWVV